jgi:hypothetical protein
VRYLRGCELDEFAYLIFDDPDFRRIGDWFMNFDVARHIGWVKGWRCRRSRIIIAAAEGFP